MKKKKKSAYFEEEFNPTQHYQQLELLPLTEIECLGYAVKEYKASADKVRRGVYAKTTDLAKKVQELTCLVESLQHQIIVMNQWILTRIGAVTTAPYQPAEFREIAFLHTTKMNVTYAGKSNPSHVQEIMDILDLSA